MEWRSPKVSLQLDSIQLKPGDVVNVYVGDVQVELRLTPNMRPEVFLRQEHMGIVRSFSEWTYEPEK